MQTKFTGLQLKLCSRDQIDASILIKPSDRVYFNEYPYRVDIDAPMHPDPNFDPVAHYYITDIMRSSNIYHKRERQSSNRRSIYLRSYADVLWLCSWGKEYVTRVVGPVSNAHVDLLHDKSYVLKDSLFFGKFNYRVEFNMIRYKRGVSVNGTNEIDAIVDFVSLNFEDYRWSNRSFAWFSNYLYCNKDEYNSLAGFMKISFSRWMAGTHAVVLLSQL